MRDYEKTKAAAADIIGEADVLITDATMLSKIESSLPAADPDADVRSGSVGCWDLVYFSGTKAHAWARRNVSCAR